MSLRKWMKIHHPQWAAVHKVTLTSVCLSHLFTYKWEVCITQNSPYTVMWLLTMYLMWKADLRTWLFSPTDWQIVSTDRMRQPESSWACQVCWRTPVVGELRIHSTVTWKLWVLQLTKKHTCNLMHSWISLVRTRLFRIPRYFFLKTISPPDLSFTRLLAALSNSIYFELFFDSPGSSK